MKSVKRISLVLAGIFVVVQFFRPPKNASEGLSPADISAKLEIPREVQTILRSSCYDCHSNNTHYPWYAEIQPVGWFLSNDIQDGKRQLNFSEYGGYIVRRQYIKLNDIIEQITEEKKPLPSYLLIHRDARLSPSQRTLVIEWAKAMEDSIRARYPADSLARRH